MYPRGSRRAPQSERQTHMSDLSDTTATPNATDRATTADSPTTLDVRPIPPAQRHPLIFQRFVALPVGGSFVLVNDHDPRPLYFQLNFEYSGKVGWEYLEQGPTVWRVRISRTAQSTAGSKDGSEAEGKTQRALPLHPAE